MKLLLIACFLTVLTVEAGANDADLPTVCISVLIRNKEHSLPYFYGALERLDYPKDKVWLWMTLDHSSDKSQQVTDKWLPRVQSLYRQVTYVAKPEPKSFATQKGILDWPEERMEHVISLKSAALAYCREVKADLLFYLDADAILVNPNTLKYLVSLQLPVVAPLLNTTAWYSNFWAGMDKRGYYLGSDLYRPIRHRLLQGVFEVPMVHSAVLVDLRVKNSAGLSFEQSKLPDAPRDDMILFAFSAKQNGIPLHIANTDFFGYLPVPREPELPLRDEAIHFRELIANKWALQNEGYIVEPFDYDAFETSKLGFDEVYMLNLPRRPERAAKMKKLLRIFNLGYRQFPAVDGQLLNNTYLAELGVKILEGYEDPFHKRPLEMDEIACFLSHYYIWEDIIKKGYKRVLILEDNAYFAQNFNEDIPVALQQADHLVPNWELMYLGRKVMDSKQEAYVKSSSSHLMRPGYSYWTLSYILTQSGAKKLLDEQPLGKMVALSEFLSIKFDKNPNVAWSSAFKNRDLVALSVQPLLVHPLSYKNQDGYYSEAEAPVVVDADGLTPEAPNIIKQVASAQTYARREL